MNRQTIRVVTGANLLAGCLLLQGCGLFGNKKGPEPIEPVPADNPTVEVQPIDTQTPTQTPTVRVAPLEPVQLPEVQMTTPYSVVKGDTISGIAYRYGLRWQDVVAVNPGINPTRMRIGQIIQLPGQVNLAHPVARPAATRRRASAPRMTAPKTTKASVPADAKTVTYYVKSGDSLSVIAYRFGVTIASIRSANNIKGDRINAGQKLKIVNPKKSYKSSAPVVSSRKRATATNIKAPVIKSRSKTAKKATPAPVTTKAKPTAPAFEKPAAPAPEKVEEVKSVEAPVEAKAEPAPAKPATPPLDVYTVKEGEDLYAIAIRWGVTPSKLRELNNLSVDADLKPGQTLKIPPQAQ